MTLPMTLREYLDKIAQARKQAKMQAQAAAAKTTGSSGSSYGSGGSGGGGGVVWRPSFGGGSGGSYGIGSGYAVAGQGGNFPAQPELRRRRWFDIEVIEDGSLFVRTGCHGFESIEKVECTTVGALFKFIGETLLKDAARANGVSDATQSG